MSNEDQEIQQISQAAADEAFSERKDYTGRWRLVVIVAAILIVINAGINIYNTIALRAEVECNAQLATAVNVVGDQSRDITKDVIDQVLVVNKNTSTEAVAKLKSKYDAGQISTKQLLDVLLNPKGQSLTTDKITKIKNTYDRRFAENTRRRAEALSHTCH